MENYLRRGIRGARFRVDKRLDRAAISRAHDVLYLSDAWTEATWLGAQALKNPLDLWVYQEIMFETRPDARDRDGHVPRRERVLPRLDLRPARRGRSGLDRHRAGARRLPGPSADHLPRRPLLDRPRRPRRGPRPRRGEADARDPRLRPLAGSRRGGARGVRAARPGRRLRDRRGLEHRADPQGPASRAARGDRDASSRRRTLSRSIERGRSS